ncbi:hypothetical protein AB0K14_14505 [Actinosynnema sp. NPDC050801]|uniref:hypothetical protein n=1 Tax=unclassified Actinosynnema TaxID=2637065 RepID=UPI0033E6765C
MTTRTRLGVGHLRWLPQAVPGFLLLIAVLLVPVTPVEATDGMYRVDTPEFSVVDGFDCAADGVLTTCTVPVAGRPLTVEVETTPPLAACAADYDGRRLTCAQVRRYGPASPWVRVGSLGIPASEAPHAPWWRDALDLWWERLVLGATLLLALLAGLAAFLLYRGPRLEDDDRLRRTMITGLSSWVLAIVSCALVTARADDDFGAMPVFVTVAVVVPAGMMACWQYVAAGPTGGRLRERFGHAVIAFVATLLLGAVQLLWLGLAVGLLD